MVLKKSLPKLFFTYPTQEVEQHTMSSAFLKSFMNFSPIAFASSQLPLSYKTLPQHVCSGS